MKQDNRYKKLRVWQEGMLLVRTLRSDYNGSRQNGFLDQMQQYAFGIPILIKEAYTQNSDIEYIQSLCAVIYICTKLSALLHSALGADIIDQTYQRSQLLKIRKISKMINRLMRINHHRNIRIKKSQSLIFPYNTGKVYKGYAYA